MLPLAHFPLSATLLGDVPDHADDADRASPGSTHAAGARGDPSLGAVLSDDRQLVLVHPERVDRRDLVAGVLARGGGADEVLDGLSGLGRSFLRAELRI